MCALARVWGDMDCKSGSTTFALPNGLSGNFNQQPRPMRSHCR